MGMVVMGLVVHAKRGGVSRARCSGNSGYRLPCWCNHVGKETPCSTSVLRTEGALLCMAVPQHHCRKVFSKCANPKSISFYE